MLIEIRLLPSSEVGVRGPVFRCQLEQAISSLAALSVLRQTLHKGRSPFGCTLELFLKVKLSSDVYFFSPIDL